MKYMHFNTGLRWSICILIEVNNDIYVSKVAYNTYLEAMYYWNILQKYVWESFLWMYFLFWAKERRLYQIKHRWLKTPSNQHWASVEWLAQNQHEVEKSCRGLLLQLIDNGWLDRLDYKRRFEKLIYKIMQYEKS